MTPHGRMVRYRLQEHLLWHDHADSRAANEPQFDIFGFDKVCIVNAAGSSYPEVEGGKGGISSWFKINLWGFGEAELFVMSNVPQVRGKLEADGTWDLPHPAFKCEAPTTFFQVLCIPFDGIVKMDFGPDEYGDGPKLYCDFAYGGEPYSRIRLFHRGAGGPLAPWIELSPDLRRPLYPSTKRWL